MSESHNRARGGQNGNKNGVKHGLYAYKAMLNGAGLDKRTSLYRALAQKEQELVTALGGDPSPQENAIIADTVKTLLFLGSLDHYLTGLKSLVRKGRAHSVLSERTRLAAHLRENLKALGLKRVPMPMQSLEAYVKEKYGSRQVEPGQAQSTGDDQQVQPEADGGAAGEIGGQGFEKSRSGAVDGGGDALC